IPHLQLPPASGYPALLRAIFVGSYIFLIPIMIIDPHRPNSTENAERRPFWPQFITLCVGFHVALSFGRQGLVSESFGFVYANGAVFLGAILMFATIRVDRLKVGRFVGLALGLALVWFGDVLAMVA